MGMFSWKCAVCKQDVIGSRLRGYDWPSQVVVLFANGDRVSGEYDGYGRVGICDSLVEYDGEFALVHKRCCPEGATFESVGGPSEGADNQGFGYGEAEMLERYGEPDALEGLPERLYHCKLCDHTWKAAWSYGKCPHGCERTPCPEHGPRTPEEVWEDAKASAGPGTSFDTQWASRCLRCEVACSHEHVEVVEACSECWDEHLPGTPCPEHKCDGCGAERTRHDLSQTEEDGVLCDDCYDKYLADLRQKRGGALAEGRTE